MKKILYLIDNLEGGGAERQFCELVRAMKDNKDYEPHAGVLLKTKEGHTGMLAGIKINYFLRNSRFDISPLFKIIRYVKKHNIDFIHSYMLMAGEFGLLAAKICRIPIVCGTIRNAKDGNWKHFLRTRYHSLFADIAIANTEAGFKNRFKKMRPHFRVVYNGMDLSRFSIKEKEKKKMRDELRVNKNQKIICMAARFTKEKDHVTLIKAVKELIKIYPDLIVLLAGTGNRKKDIENLVLRYDLNKNVRFLGFRNDVEKIISISDISILLTNTKIHFEGIANTLIESMALQVPVIATAGGGTDELVVHKLNGIKVRAFDEKGVVAAVEYLFAHKKERAKMISNAYQMVSEKYTLKRYLEDNIRIYGELF